MKKVLLVIAVALFSFTANAQLGGGQFSGGVNIGIPVGTMKAQSSFSYGLDVNYMLNSGEEFSYGIATGYQNYSGKNGIPSVDFIPLALAGRYAVSEQVSIGADLGYAMSSNGGFYYRPMVVYNLSETMKFNASYSGVSVTGGTVSNVGAGIMFNF